MTAYPEAKKVIDYDKLDLRSFDPGAILLRSGGKTDYLGDPLRQPSSLLSTVLTSAASIADKINILKTKSRITKKTINNIFESEEMTTLQLLKNKYGFSDRIISQFLRPFYAGIFLEQDLTTSSRMFDFVFKMFSEGDAAIPAKGMEAIPQQILSHLDPNNILLSSRVNRIDGHTVILENNKTITATNIIIATEATGLASKIAKLNDSFRSTINIYYKSPVAPFEKKAIALSTDVGGIVNNMTCMTNVSDNYSSGIEHLISVSLKADVAYDAINTESKVKDELSKWYPSASEWEYIKAYHVKYALPLQDHVVNEGIVKPTEHIVIIGDHTMNGSINSAMKSGRLGAEWVINR